MPPQLDGRVAIGDTVGHAVPFMHRLDCHVPADSDVEKNGVWSSGRLGCNVDRGR
jgi:hypothetical protein